MLDIQDMSALERRLSKRAPSMRLTRHASMADYTTLRLGGPADLMAEPADEAQLRATLDTAADMGVPVTLMGRGSNLLVLDGGIRGLVIRLCGVMNGVEAEGCILRTGAGALLSSAALAAAERGLSGLAFAGGIPGTVGGGIYMNAGAYGGELGQVTERVEGLTMAGEPFAYTAEEMAFSHRHTRLMEENVVVTRVTFRLAEGGREAILAEMADLKRRRAEKQPLQQPSAGSTFKRPANGYASALIDQCGLKGMQVGGAQVSEKHAGFLVNLGGTAADFLQLMAKVQRAVLDRTGIWLEPEVRIVGEAAPARGV